MPDVNAGSRVPGKCRVCGSRGPVSGDGVCRECASGPGRVEAGVEGSEANAARVNVGAASFDWPLPEKGVQIAGSTMSLEVAVVAGIYGLAGVWLLVELHSLITEIPTLLTGLFGGPFEFAFSWLILLVAALMLYIVVAFLYTAYALFRADPVGRGLVATIAAALVLLLFTSTSSGPLALIAFIAVLAAVVLFLSPWARRALASSPRRHGRPAPVVLAQSIALSYFSLMGAVGVLLLPGFRFISEMGGQFVFFEIFTVAACTCVFLGYRQLRSSRSQRARLLLSTGCGINLLAALISQGGVAFVIALTITAGVCGPLWLAPAARDWFGDSPIGAAS